MATLSDDGLQLDYYQEAALGRVSENLTSFLANTAHVHYLVPPVVSSYMACGCRLNSHRIVVFFLDSVPEHVFR
jgi:hypothetical protein